MEFTYNFKASETKPNILPYVFSIFLTLVVKTRHTYIKETQVNTDKERWHDKKKKNDDITH